MQSSVWVPAMKCVVVLLLSVPFIAGANASDLDSMTLAEQLGTILAAEEPCHLTYDMSAIKKYVAATVRENDMSFGSLLEMMVQGEAIAIRDMTPATLAALCAQTERVARFNGFIH
jgi:hypothetical protein